jgi:hypothetical protein
VDHLLRWDDPAAVLTVHGLGGALGLIALGIFADGKAGAGWNGVGAESYLGVAGQGVTGLLAAAGYQPDWPGQMEAQIVGLAALALFGFFVSWLLLAPPAILLHLLQPRPMGATPSTGTAIEDANPPISPFSEATEAVEGMAIPAPATSAPSAEPPIEDVSRTADRFADAAEVAGETTIPALDAISEPPVPNEAAPERQESGTPGEA